MRDFWTFIGGVAVGILAVTGVLAMEEEDRPRSVEHDEGELDELNGEIEQNDGNGGLIVRAS